MEKQIEITDRYKATGTPYPTKDSCNECDGMGVYPVSVEMLNDEAVKSPKGRVLVIGQKDNYGSPCADDGFLFIQCPYCNGSRITPSKDIIN